MPVLESQIEQRCVQIAREKRAVWIKLVKLRGIPDRLLIYHGHVVFVELKRDIGILTPMQYYWHRLLRSHGMRVEVLDRPEALRSLIQALE